MLDNYLIEDKDGFLGLETAWIDNFANLNNMLSFLFDSAAKLIEIAGKDGKQIFDLTAYKPTCISFTALEENYQQWIKISGRENTMDEYGDLLGVIGYIHRHIDKKNLLVIAEKRKHSE